MNDDDDLVLRAKRTAAELNWLLDRLAEHGIHCAGLSHPQNDGYSVMHDRRVELMLLFRAKKAAG